MSETDVGELITLLRIDIAKLDTKVDSFKDIGKKVDDVKEKQARLEEQTVSSHKRISKLESNQTWLWRSVVSAVLLAILSMVLSGGGGA